MPAHIHPFSFFHLLASRLAQKVNPDPNRSAYQQKLSGMLAIALVVIPFVLLIWLFRFFFSFPEIFDGLLLFISLQWGPIRLAARRTAELLEKDQKEAAKDVISPWLARDTHALSPMGIAKATSEMLMLRSAQTLFTTTFVFLLFGGVGAFLYRLLLELHHTWTCKKPNNIYFGSAIHLMMHMLHWFPYRMWGGLMAISNRVTHLSFRFQKEESTLLSIAASAIGCRLGGPRYYEQRRIDYPNWHGGEEPDFRHIRKSKTIVDVLTILWLVILGIFLGAEVTWLAITP